MKKLHVLLAAMLSMFLSVPVLAAPPAQPDLADVTGFITAAIPTITAVAAASLSLLVAVKIFKWVRRAL